MNVVLKCSPFALIRKLIMRLGIDIMQFMEWFLVEEEKLFCSTGSKLEESSTSAFSKVESSSSASSSNDILGGSLGSRMMEADTSNNTKDSELADSGVDEELEPPEEEAVFSDPDEDDDNDTVSVKPDSDGKEKDYQFKPIHKEGIDDQEEQESNEDVTELEEFESLGDEVKELIVKFSQERYFKLS